MQVGSAVYSWATNRRGVKLLSHRFFPASKCIRAETIARAVSASQEPAHRMMLMTFRLKVLLGAIAISVAVWWAVLKMIF